MSTWQSYSDTMKTDSSLQILLHGVYLLTMVQDIIAESSNCNTPKLGPTDTLTLTVFDNQNSIEGDMYNNMCDAIKQFPKGLIKLDYKPGGWAKGSPGNIQCGGSTCQEDKVQECVYLNSQNNFNDCYDPIEIDYPKMLHCYCEEDMDKTLLENAALRASWKVPDSPVPTLAPNKTYDPCLKFGSTQDFLNYFCQVYQKKVALSDMPPLEPRQQEVGDESSGPNVQPPANVDNVSASMNVEAAGVHDVEMMAQEERNGAVHANVVQEKRPTETRTSDSGRTSDGGDGPQDARSKKKKSNKRKNGAEGQKTEQGQLSKDASDAEKIKFLMKSRSEQQKDIEVLKKHNAALEKSLSRARLDAKGKTSMDMSPETERRLMDRLRREMRGEVDQQMRQVENTASIDNESLSESSVEESDSEEERNIRQERNSNRRDNVVTDELVPNLSTPDLNFINNAVRQNNDSLREGLGISALVERDSTKLDYHLTAKKNFKMWRSMFDMELSLKRLSDVVNDNAPPPRLFSNNERAERQKIVRGIILGHIDESYQEQVIDIAEPKSMLDRLHALKRSEVNDTTVSIKDQLRTLKFNLGSETVHAFNLKFDDLIRRYNLVSGEPMSEQDKRDAYYYVVAKAVPSIKETTYNDFATGKGEGYSFDQMRRYVQCYEAQNRSTLQIKSMVRGMMNANVENRGSTVRCYNCGSTGHMARDCDRPVGEYLCYNCDMYGHVGRDCPQPDRRQSRSASGKRRLENEGDGTGKRYRYGQNNGGSFRGNSRRGGHNNRRGGNRGRANYQNQGNRQNSGKGQGGNNYQQGNGNFRGQNNKSGRGRGKNKRGNKNQTNKGNYNTGKAATNANNWTGVRSRGEDDNRPEAQANVLLPPYTPMIPMLPPPPPHMPYPLQSLPPFGSIFPPSMAPEYIPLGRDNPLANVEVLKQHLIYKDNQWWMDRTATEGDLFSRQRDRTAPPRENPCKEDTVPPSKERESDPGNIIPALKNVNIRRDDDEPPNAGAAMVAGGGNSVSKSSPKLISFIADSGASEHAIKERYVLHNFQLGSETMRSANKKQSSDLIIKGKGSLFMKSNIYPHRPIEFKEVRYSPNISENLYALRKFTDAGFSILLDAQELKIFSPHTKENLLTARYIDPYWIIELEIIQPADVQQAQRQYESKRALLTCSSLLETDLPNLRPPSDSGGAVIIESESTSTDSKVPETTNTSVGQNKDSEKTDSIQTVNPTVTHKTQGLDQPYAAPSKEVDLASLVDTEHDLVITPEDNLASCNLKLSKGFIWHTKLGHASIQYLKELQKRSETLKGIIFDDSIKDCDTCMLINSTKLPFTENRLRAIRPLQTIHADLIGPIEPRTFPQQYRFICVIIDDYSRLAMAYAMKSKDETGYFIERFIVSARNMLGRDEKICYLQTDQGTEFTGGYTQIVLEREKMELKSAPPYTPEHNGLVERFNRTLFSKMRAMTLDSGYPAKHWDVTMRAAIYVYNRTPHRSLNFDIPITKFNPNVKFEADQIKRFGSLAYLHLPKVQQGNKMTPKAIRTFVVGYLATGFLLYHPSSGKYFESKHVRFRESIVLKQLLPHHANTENLTIGEDQEVTRVDGASKVPGKLVEPGESNPKLATQGEKTDETVEIGKRKRNDTEVEVGTKRKQLKEAVKSDIMTRSKSKLVDSSFQQLMLDQGNCQGFFFQEHHEASLKDCKDSHDEIQYQTLAKVNQDPVSYSDAMSRPDRNKWAVAIQEELDSMFRNKVWHYVDRPKAKVIDSKWVFKLKQDHAKPKYKGRMVIRGFKNENIYELSETYAPVARASTVKAFLAIANKYKMDIAQMDVKHAFLHGTIEEDIYMEIPEGIKCSDEFRRRKVCKLDKSLYGLKISSQRWNKRFTDVIKQLGFTPCPNDPCLFRWISQNKIAYLLLYVDDMLIASNCKIKIEEVKNHLTKNFEMTDLGKPEKFLGLEISRDLENSVMRITQTKYCDKILERFHMRECREHFTPMVTKANQVKHNLDEKRVTNAPYREAIGSLLYLQGGSRPDLSFAINWLSRSQIEPSEEDWISVKRVFRYCKGTRELGLTYLGKGEELEVYTDSSFADWEGSQSTSGYVIKLFDDTIAWRSHKQSFVTLSTCEAEYVSLSEGCMEAMAIHKIVEFMLNREFYPVKMYCDNKAAVNCVSLAQPVRLRHCLYKNIDYVKEAEREKRVKVTWIGTTDQIADIMTKALPVATHTKLRRIILNEKDENKPQRQTID